MSVAKPWMLASPAPLISHSLAGFPAKAFSQRMGFGAVPHAPVAAPVVNVHVTGLPSAFPATSVTPLVSVAVYSVLVAKALVGVRVAVRVALV